ncbi:MAG: lipoprotein-releasing system ATP-binding protein LolD [Flavobacteriaceae bacterium]|nr:lipoprotein-releasing system ATP-binding protein LolD [Flavobacteriaceae bacterium]
MIEAEKLRKSYNGKVVLDVPSLIIEQSQIVSICGPSGAGKTTLLSILGTLMKVDDQKEGSLKIMNEDINKMSLNNLAKFRNNHLGFIFQFHELLDEFNVIENIIIPGLIGNKDKKLLLKKATEILKILNIVHLKLNNPKNISGGEKQRVAVARSLINNPSIIFADEPSGNLDARNADELHNLFFRLRDEFGQTFVIVTHNEKLSKISDKILKLVDGKIQAK